MIVHGRCHCGKISFEGMVEPDKVNICHCSDCQKLTGTAFRANIQTPSESFVIHGQPKIYVKTADSGAKRAHAFCPNCGTPIYAAAPENTKTYSLRVGTLDERAQLRPIRQIWSRSALPWSMDLRGLEKIDRQ